ncbi:growth arrest-specific protein 7-like [Coregonus clupeaformis]|uniref:growth arrest-specific protein 7-like n=1 Tax=Coregonus clupeaformis TaxID=59861 RepID=UPI001BE08507|nr:growth arrest-specific protein 7-like [Coregonus clupeaformis]
MKPVAASPAPGDEIKTVPLPQGWRCHMSPEGCRYYINTASKETTWERPSASYGTPVRPPAQRNSLPEVNGSCHTTGSAMHPTDPPGVPLRRATMDKQVRL